MSFLRINFHVYGVHISSTRNFCNGLPNHMASQTSR